MKKILGLGLVLAMGVAPALADELVPMPQLQTSQVVPLIGTPAAAPAAADLDLGLDMGLSAAAEPVVLAPAATARPRSRPEAGSVVAAPRTRGLAPRRAPVPAATTTARKIITMPWQTGVYQ